jgi:hypothetical protein
VASIPSRAQPQLCIGFFGIETSIVSILSQHPVIIEDHASAERGSLRRTLDFCAGCTVRRNPNAAKITARVSRRGLPRSESVRYSVSRESPVLSANAVIPPTASTMVRSATGTARASPSSSIASMYAATSASFRRCSAAMNGRLGEAGFVVFPVRMGCLDILRLCAFVTTT